MVNSIIYKIVIESTLQETIVELEKKLANNQYIVVAAVSENVATITTAFRQKQVLKG